MTGAGAHAENIALSLLQDLKEGVTAGRIADMKSLQSEIDDAMSALNGKRSFEDSSRINDRVETLIKEIRSLHEKVAKCETKLADFQQQAKALKDDTAQIATSAEACNLLVEQQQKENGKALASTETSAQPCCVVPGPPPVLRQAPSQATISFPGGPRTVTIHPPGSPNYQSTIRDEKGEVIIEFRRPKPLRREGAFRGSLDEIDWQKIKRVCGRAPEQSGVQELPPSPLWPDRSQPYVPPPSRNPSWIIARQYQLAASLHTDAFGRLQPPEHLLLSARSPSLPTGMSSLVSLPESLPCSSGWRDSSVAPSMPRSPSVEIKTKRVRKSDDDDEDTPVATGSRIQGARSIDLRMIKREDDEDVHEVKRKRLRAPPSWEGLAAANRSLFRSI